MKINRCLISVSNKSNLIELAKFLSSQNIEIISTGGTAKFLKENNIKTIDISDFTGFPEIMDGRVKTLHPKVHGGLLGEEENNLHLKQARENDIKSIDLIIINLYPFVETINKTNDEKEIIENIDIGGPAMIRSGAKNFLYKTVITSVDHYQELIDEMKKNNQATSLEFRKNMARIAFENIAKYDLAISNWFNENFKDEEKDSEKFEDNFVICGNLKQQLRYGENSHQKAAIYSNSNLGIVNAKQLQGKELSYNNINDADAAYNLILEFEKPACAIIKHANPCGVAIDDNVLNSYQKALSCDSKSAFGGIVAINREINKDLALEMTKMFYEVIIAPAFSKEAEEIFLTKKNLRLLILDFKKLHTNQIKSVSGGFLIQELDQKLININDLQLVSKTSVDKTGLEQLVFAMSVCKHVKSNAIVVTKNFQTYGFGAGQTSRVDACEIACKKASQFFDGVNFIDKAKEGFLASDAFFPFADNIEIASSYGIKAIVATGGSIRDDEVIQKANEKNIALYFISTRHFKH